MGGHGVASWQCWRLPRTRKSKLLFDGTARASASRCGLEVAEKERER